MNHPDVALTDYALFIECGSFVYFLARKCHRKIWAIIFFASAAVASLAAGTYHGFLEDPAVAQDTVFWPLAMFAIGISSLAGIKVAADISLEPKGARVISGVAWIAFFAYCLAVEFRGADFRIAIAGYAPSLFFLAWAFVHAYRKSHKGFYLTGLMGIGTVIIASVVQQARIGIHPRYFNHNAVYHVLQGAGLNANYLAFKMNADTVE